jgi:hypothetical protein
MPDIRDVLNALDNEDRVLYSKTRTAIRTAYMKAVVAVIGVERYNEHDDAFLDLIDIKVATLFDRGGRFDGTKVPLDQKLAEAQVIEQKVQDAGLRIAAPKTGMSNATASMQPNGQWK